MRSARSGRSSPTLVKAPEVGDEVWSALLSGPWTREAEDGAPCFGGACDRAGLADAGRSPRPIARTFRERATPDSIDGVPVRHLRSIAGTVGDHGPIPGSTDLWASKETGIPIGIEFDGRGILQQTTIGGVDDPANAVVRPESRSCRASLRNTGSIRTAG